MSISDIGIANIALAKLGTAPIVSFADQVTAAQAIRDTYETFRDKLLRVYRWNFNRVYATIAASTSTPPFEYAYAYPLPADYLRLELCGNSGDLSVGPTLPGVNLSPYMNARQQDYRIVSGSIYTNYLPPLQIIYARRVTDPNQFDLGFVETFACYLAWQLCDRITGSVPKRQALAQEFQQSLREALQTKSIELAPETIPDDSWMLARLAG